MDSIRYKPKNKIRFVTAASLYDGHDVSINIIRRMLQDAGAEVIHLGHNRPVKEVIQSALQENVQGIAVSSYQGGHVEYFKYLIDLLKENNASHICVFGGGGGVIVPSERQELHQYGVKRIYTPEDGMTLGLEGIIDDIMAQSDFLLPSPDPKKIHFEFPAELAKAITIAETGKTTQISQKNKKAVVVGITGTGGAGKSSLTDELVRRISEGNPEIKIGILCIDPSRKKTGGALLGDRIRMNSIYRDNIFLHSLASRGESGGISHSLKQVLDVLTVSGTDIVLIETSGTGQTDSQITEYTDFNIYVMTQEFGAPTQLEKISMLDYADMVAINKFDRRGSEDALRDVQKQLQRNFKKFEVPVAEMPVFGTIASNFNDPGVSVFYENFVLNLKEKTGFDLAFINPDEVILEQKKHRPIIASERNTYLDDVVSSIRKYYLKMEEASSLSGKWQAVLKTSAILDEDLSNRMSSLAVEMGNQLSEDDRRFLSTWKDTVNSYKQKEIEYSVREKKIRQEIQCESLAGIRFPIVSLPETESWADLIRYKYRENMPGHFPFTAGVFPFKKSDEMPTRMFAGEGGPERTNKRFHLLSQAQSALRLSTAFDSVTLYGEDPAHEADNYGKIGNSGVSVPTLDDAKKLYSGFDLTAPTSSVSMTINGPAPILLAFYFNAVIDLEAEKMIRRDGRQEEYKKKVNEYFLRENTQRPEYNGSLPANHNGLGLLFLGVSSSDIITSEIYNNIKKDALEKVRGTVQADILKEDQAQNTCIFSTEFALRMMGDVQEYFIKNCVRNFYSVSISGYHIAEAGANPVTQLAFTLANAFTYVEYYLSRGMKIDDFAPNFSFFFSNGLDPEYSVMGRVARRIWAIAMKYLYGGSERSQKLKYHIQTSGRSLHAQEIDFNDIRTTLQALYAIFDNTNSLHTNSYDEAITTPTEDSVRRALAIQLIIQEELGLNKNQNPFQGSYIIEELSHKMEEAVLLEFEKISRRGGVLGAMETLYQRSKIQDESMHYEKLKHSGDLKIIGVNSFQREGKTEDLPSEIIRSTDEEKKFQISSVESFHKRHHSRSAPAIESLRKCIMSGGNIFSELMESVQCLSLGQITQVMYNLGGKYRRGM